MRFFVSTLSYLRLHLILKHVGSSFSACWYCASYFVSFIHHTLLDHVLFDWKKLLFSRSSHDMYLSNIDGVFWTDILDGWYSFAAMFLVFEFLSNFLPSKYKSVPFCSFKIILSCPLQKWTTAASCGLLLSQFDGHDFPLD